MPKATEHPSISRRHLILVVSAAAVAAPVARAIAGEVPTADAEILALAAERTILVDDFNGKSRFADFSEEENEARTNAIVAIEERMQELVACTPAGMLAKLAVWMELSMPTAIAKGNYDAVTHVDMMLVSVRDDLLTASGAARGLGAWHSPMVAPDTTLAGA
jgi:hypothetical protein